MDLSKNYASKYLTVSDLLEFGGGVRATLADVKDVRIKDENKNILEWVEDLKPLVLNRSNFEQIRKLSGTKESDDLLGRQFTLEVRRLKGFRAGEPDFDSIVITAIDAPLPPANPTRPAPAAPRTARRASPAPAPEE